MSRINETSPARGAAFEEPSGHIGTALPRFEDEALLTGKARYVGDIDRPGQVWARVVRSNDAHAQIVSIDPTAALRRDDVLAVITANDLPGVRIPIRIAPSPEAETVLQPPLARDLVRYVGEPVAIVVALDPYSIEDAAEAVAVETESLEPVLDARTAAGENCPIVQAELGGNVVNRLRAEHGDGVEALFREADVVVSERLRIQRHAAIPMETRGLVAEYDRAAGKLTVWGPTKVKHFNRRALSQMLEMSTEAIRLVEPHVGGAFGARGELYPEDFLIPWLAIELGRPVKWIEDRAEHFMASNHSREQECEFELAASRDGELLCFRSRSWVNLGAYVRTQGLVLPRLTMRHMAGPYRWHAFEAEALAVLTNKTPAGTYRAPGQFEAAFCRERMLDILACRLGIDPVELRRRNLIPVNHLPRQVDLGPEERPLSHERSDYAALWEELLSRASYGELRRDLDSRRAAGELVGLGTSAFIEEEAAGQFEQAHVVPQPDGRFVVHVGIASVGQGVATALAQIAADSLGVPAAAIDISHHDTDTVPEGMGAFASRTTVFGGNAIAGAVHDLNAKARAAAAARWSVTEDRIEIGAGLACLRGSNQDAAPFHSLGCEGRHRFEKKSAGVSMGANLSVVRIDPQTGGVKVERHIVAYDVGRAINPMLVSGQLIGGAAQGIAGALLEELHYEASGQPLSTSFMDYAMPTASEVPAVETVVIESASDHRSNPLGVKGCGEGGVIGAGAAVANAVADALRDESPVTRLPLTPAAVVELLDQPSRSRGADREPQDGED